MDLVAFLNGRLDADENWARPVLGDPSASDIHGFADRFLREVEAKRRILAEHTIHSEPETWDTGEPTGGTNWWCDACDHDRDYGHIGGPDEGCPTLRALAVVYSDHPDYDPAWT